VPMTPWFGVTIKLVMVAGVVKVGAVVPEKGSGATPGRSVGAASEIGAAGGGVSAPLAGALSVKGMIETIAIPVKIDLRLVESRFCFI
jgi:hypothetical protein